MTLKKFSQTVEIKFWKSLTPLMSDKGLIIKGKRWAFNFLHAKPKFLALLILLGSTVGFAAGLLIGRVMGFFPLR